MNNTNKKKDKLAQSKSQYIQDKQKDEIDRL